MHVHSTSVKNKALCPEWQSFTNVTERLSAVIVSRHFPPNGPITAATSLSCKYRVRSDNNNESVTTLATSILLVHTRTLRTTQGSFSSSPSVIVRNRITPTVLRYASPAYPFMCFRFLREDDL